MQVCTQATAEQQEELRGVCCITHVPASATQLTAAQLLPGQPMRSEPLRACSRESTRSNNLLGPIGKPTPCMPINERAESGRCSVWHCHSGCCHCQASRAEAQVRRTNSPGTGQSYLSQPTVCLASVPSTGRTRRYCTEVSRVGVSQGGGHNQKTKNIVPEVRVSSLSSVPQRWEVLITHCNRCSCRRCCRRYRSCCPSCGQAAETLWAAGEWQRHLPLQDNSTATVKVPDAASNAAVPCNSAGTSSSPATLWSYTAALHG